MLRYFARSYSDWLHKADLTSFGVPALPECALPLSLATLSSPCHISLITSHFQRWALWLTHTSLFTESWLLVVSNDANWWWSAEVCLFTVGAWATYLQTQRRRFDIPHAWAYMLLGQTVAVSFAASLFNLALALRALPDGTLLQRTLFRSHSHEARNRDGIVREKEEEVVVEPVPGSSTLKRTRKVTTTLTHYHLEAPSGYPGLGSRLLLWSLTSLAAMTALRPNQSFSQVLAMHALPLVPTLPSAWLKNLAEHIDTYLLHPSPGSEHEEAVRASNARVKSLLRPSRLFALFAIFGLASKLATTLALLRTVLVSVPLQEQLHYGRARILLRLLYPTTFHSHPAQSSISSDAANLALITVAQIAFDAIQLPKALDASKHSSSVLKSHVLRHWSLPALILAGLTPVLGPSTTFPAWLSLREHHIEQAELRDEQALRRAAGGDNIGLVVSETRQDVIERIVDSKSISIGTDVGGDVTAASVPESVDSGRRAERKSAKSKAP